MTVCNACRYCEAYCPVFPAMEKHLVFSADNLAHLANLCHDCGECLYACQFAPPHEFGIDVPRTMAALRLESYEEYCWPGIFRGAFRRHRVGTPLALAVLAAIVVVALAVGLGEGLQGADLRADFYRVVPHDAMVGLFGAAGSFAVLVLGIGVLRFWRAISSGRPPVGRPQVGRPQVGRPGQGGSLPAGGRDRRHILNNWRAVIRALREAGSLTHLHGSGEDCTLAEEQRAPWRRWFHHVTFYGFLLCFASTSVAALYHVLLGWRAPYGYLSLPVILGTVGGVGLLVGPAGLMALRRATDGDRVYPDQRALNTSFIALLFLTSLTGLVLLVLRQTPWMSALLVVHLAAVLALFLMLPYGKFVHGVYRTAALIRLALDESAPRPGPPARPS